ncbi:hypothetical protein J4Q44_G00272870 [Coregonus suidteri]|uniref:Uncharacterized protein n=1 Tax=Coregonus suidteri TaxID=861788 RepID=A0AAN8QV48_9TELE
MKTHCLLATIHRLVLEHSFYCGLVRKYAGTAANSVLLNTASHPGISLLLLSKSHSPSALNYMKDFYQSNLKIFFTIFFIYFILMDKPLLCGSPEKSSGHRRE